MAEPRWALLDTDAWSELFARSRKRNPDPRVTAWRATLAGHQVAIATQTRAEVLAGMAIKDLGATRRGQILGQLDKTITVPVTEDVVVAYADLQAACQRGGHALHAKQHTADRWVAATAIGVGLPLLAGDGIYRNAPGLELLD